MKSVGIAFDHLSSSGPVEGCLGAGRTLAAANAFLNASNRDGSPKRMKLPQCPAAPISYVKQTGTCISNHKAIDLACCDAIPR